MLMVCFSFLNLIVWFELLRNFIECESLYSGGVLGLFEQMNCLVVQSVVGWISLGIGLLLLYDGGFLLVVFSLISLVLLDIFYGVSMVVDVEMWDVVDLVGVGVIGFGNDVVDCGVFLFLNLMELIMFVWNYVDGLLEIWI